MKITISKDALKRHGRSAAVTARSIGVPMSAIKTVKSSQGQEATITLRPRNAERKHVARGRKAGAHKPLKGKGSYRRVKV